jgi:hypothetical protein
MAAACLTHTKHTTLLLLLTPAVHPHGDASCSARSTPQAHRCCCRCCWRCQCLQRCRRLHDCCCCCSDLQCLSDRSCECEHLEWLPVSDSLHCLWAAVCQPEVAEPTSSTICTHNTHADDTAARTELFENDVQVATIATRLKPS